MDSVQIVSVIVAVTAAAGAVLSYFKWKPGQREEFELTAEQARVNVAQGTLNVAQGTINLVTSELEDQFRRMAAQIRDLETRYGDQSAATVTLRDEMQARIDELSAGLRAEKEEKAAVSRENVRLLVRVKHLEDEVAALKDGKRVSEARADRDDERAERADERAERADVRADRTDVRADLAGERAGLSDARATRADERAELNEARAVRADEREARRDEEKNGE